MTTRQHSASDSASDSLTRIERLSKNKSALETIVNVSADGIVVIDANARVRFANPAALKLFGRTRDEFLDTEFAFPIAGEGLEITILQRNGEGINVVYAEMRIAAFQWEGEDAQLLSLRETTQNVRQRQELAKTIAQLKATNENLNQFATIASHDLREPLRTVQNFSRIIKERYGDGFDDEARRWFTFIEMSTAEMQKLVARLHEYAKTGTVEFEWEKVDLKAVAENAVKLLEKRIQETGTTVEIRDLPFCAGSAAMLQQVFQNLISNAIHHCGVEEPHIVISGSQRIDSVAICVADNGVGVSNEDAERIFQLFARGSRSKKNNGTGIGLATCARVVQIHRGEIWVEPDDSGGKFHFSLPRRTPKEITQE